MSKVVKSKSLKTNKKVVDETIPIINEEIITKKRVIRKKTNNVINSKSIKNDNIESKSIKNDNKDLDIEYKQTDELVDNNEDKEDTVQSDIESDSVESEEIEDEKEEDDDKDEEKEEFDEEIIDKKIDYLEKEPEAEDCVYDLEYDEIYDTELDKQAIEVDKENRITKNIMTSYERVRVLGIRSKQITMGAKVLIKCDESLSAMEKAKLELETGMTPLKIKRTLPNNKFEIWKISELIQK